MADDRSKTLDPRYGKLRYDVSFVAAVDAANSASKAEAVEKAWWPGCLRCGRRVDGARLVQEDDGSFVAVLSCHGSEEVQKHRSQTASGAKVFAQQRPAFQMTEAEKAEALRSALAADDEEAFEIE